MAALPPAFRLFMRGIFVLSFGYVSWQMLSPSVPSDLAINDKLVHFVVFGWLALTLDWSRWLSHPRAWLWMVSGLAVYGAALEIGQYFVPGRSMSLLDWLADVAGIAVYFLGIRWLQAGFRRAWN